MAKAITAQDIKNWLDRKPANKGDVYSAELPEILQMQELLRGSTPEGNLGVMNLMPKVQKV